MFFAAVVSLVPHMASTPCCYSTIIYKNLLLPQPAPHTSRTGASRQLLLDFLCISTAAYALLSYLWCCDVARGSRPMLRLHPRVAAAAAATPLASRACWCFFCCWLFFTCSALAFSMFCMCVLFSTALIARTDTATSAASALHAASD